jgi:hypothetical protein
MYTKGVWICAKETYEHIPKKKGLLQPKPKAAGFFFFFSLSFFPSRYNGSSSSRSSMLRRAMFPKQPIEGFLLPNFEHSRLNARMVHA